MRCNLGLQYIWSDQQADGFDAVAGKSGVVATPVSESHDYTDLLPSANLDRAHGRRDRRLGASRTMTRTRLDRLKPGSSIVFDYGNNIPGANIERSPWSANSGDPTLEPITVNQYDLGLEYYYAKDGYVSASLFLKDLVNWQASSKVPKDFTQFYYTGLIPSGSATLTTCPPLGVCTFDGYDTTTLEFDGGRISGIEFQAAWGNAPQGGNSSMRPRIPWSAIREDNIVEQFK